MRTVKSNNQNHIHFVCQNIDQVIIDDHSTYHDCMLDKVLLILKHGLNGHSISRVNLSRSH